MIEHYDGISFTADHTPNPIAGETEAVLTGGVLRECLGLLGGGLWRGADNQGTIIEQYTGSD